MKQIWFKYKFFDKIKNKEKTQTIRFWKRCNFQNNSEIELFFGFNKPRILARIKEILIKNFEEISDDEVKQDGFQDKQELLQELKIFYPEFCEKKSDLFLIKFEIKNEN